jgi:Zn-dependent protease
VVLLIAFTIHELAHAVTADRLGDPTPRRMGRITLNPLAHLDPLGTILLLLAGFGWAKPVMVNPMNFRGNPRTGMAIVAAAGPISNLVMAALGALIVRFGIVSLNELISGAFPSPGFFLSVFIQINLILAFFNLIPIPPLDGSKILFAMLPAEWAYRLRPLEQYGFLFLMGIVFLVPTVLDYLIVLPSQITLRFLLGLG